LKLEQIKEDNKEEQNENLDSEVVKLSFQHKESLTASISYGNKTLDSVSQ
jgi:hypothetical protein